MKQDARESELVNQDMIHPQDMIKPGLVLQNRYKVIKKLGQGGMGNAWKVEDRYASSTANKWKVLKVLLDDFPKMIELFKREAEVLKQLKHSGLPRVEPDDYFIFQSEGTTKPLHCLVMEFIEGQDLKKWLEQPGNQPITQEQAIDWLNQLVEILAQVHEHKYFHRDIKLSNIMLRQNGQQNGQLVMIDFGTVRILTDTYIEKRQNHDVTRIYSFGYTAPEQLRGQACPQSDFFALGRTFVYLLTGKPPEYFEEDSQTFQFKQNWRDSAPQISKPLADLIDALIEPLPKMRPENAQIILQRIANISLADSVRFHLKGLPEPLKLLAEPILKLNLLLWQQKTRVPKIGLYGRAGSGKSSLINAIMGTRVAKIDDVKPGTIAPTTYDKEQNGWKLTFVDSRGVGDSPSEEALKQAINYIVKEGIDVLLFVIPANDRAVGSDYKFLEKLKAAHQRRHGTELPVILVINKIDLMPPEREWNPPYNLNLHSPTTSTRKEAKIRECIQFRVQQYKELTDRYVPVCAKWRDNEDDRYNIQELALKIYDLIPDETKPGFAGAAAATEVKKTLAGTITSFLALIAGSTCLIPMPFIDAIAVFSIQVYLVSTIAQIASNNQDQYETATQFINDLGGVSGKLGTTLFVQQVAKIIPGIGVPLNAGPAAIVAALTNAIGAAAVGHFIDGISIEEAKQRYDELNASLREEFKKAFTGGEDKSAKAENIAEKLQKTSKDMNERYGMPSIYVSISGDVHSE